MRTLLPRAATRRSALILATTALAGVASTTAGKAAGPRPLFQMPVPCGQMWEATTYDGHWPDQDSLDMGQWDPSDNNISEGEPALASAAGAVDKVYKEDNGEYRVYLDHGDGWKTHYIHLESLPPLTVGQKVAQGEQVGRIGRSGTEEFHLHYTQLEDGKAVRAYFNGKAVATYAADKSSWGKWPSRTGEQIVSYNCPQNRFLQFNQDSRQHILAYRPENGNVGISKIKTNGEGIENVWSGDWKQQWTSFTPFEVNGKPHYFAYKAATGEVDFDRVNANGQGVTTIHENTWGKNWSEFMPFKLGSNTFFMAYDVLNGYANLCRIKSDGKGIVDVWKGNWGKGWTHVAPFVLGGTQYFIAYRGSTGAVEIDKITKYGSGSAKITEVWSGNWGAGWSHIVPVPHDGSVHLLRYQATTGLASFEKMKASGQGIQNLGAANWTKTWTAFSPYTINGKGHVMGYKASSGQAKALKLNAGATAMDTIAVQSWTKGLA